MRNHSLSLTLTLIASLTVIAGCDDGSDHQLDFYEAVDAEAEHLSDDQLDLLYSAKVEASTESSEICDWANMDLPSRPAYKQCFGGYSIVEGWVVYTGNTISELDWSFAGGECLATLEPFVTVVQCDTL